VTAREHDPLCGCALREHHCLDNWAGILCIKCECRKIAAVRAAVAEQIAAAIEGNNHLQSCAFMMPQGDCYCGVDEHAAIARRVGGVR
jgi:hypothetical protein